MPLENNQNPTAYSDSFAVHAGNLLINNVLHSGEDGNADYDLDHDILTVIEVDGEAANVGAQITLPSGALLTLNGDGTFNYNPNGFVG